MFNEHFHTTLAADRAATLRASTARIAPAPPGSRLSEFAPVLSIVAGLAGLVLLAGPAL